MKTKLIVLLFLAVLPAFAQRLAIRGQPLSIAYMDNQNLVDRGVIAIVLEDDGQKRLVTGNCTSRRAAAEIIAMVQAEIDDGDDQEIVVHCTRKQAQPENDRGYQPGPSHEQITQLEVEGYKWNRRVWSQ